jgi:hypothetical protein
VVRYFPIAGHSDLTHGVEFCALSGFMLKTHGFCGLYPKGGGELNVGGVSSVHNGVVLNLPKGGDG